MSQLVRLSEVLVTFGVTLENILLPFLFIILPFLSFTIPMAFLFAVLIAFSRLSSDGEFTAMLSAGFSLKRAAFPVMSLGISLYIIAALSALNLEPWGRRELVNFYKRKAQTELDNMIKYKLQSGVFMDDFLGYVLYAEKISDDRTRFDNVLLAPGRGKTNQRFTLLSPSGSILGSVEDGDLKMAFDYGVIYSTAPGAEQTSVVKFKRAEIDILRIFQEQIFGPDHENEDYRAMGPVKLFKHIDILYKERFEAEGNERRYFKARYLFHQRSSIPFSTITFALFAMVLGIQDQRRGKSGAYLGALMTIVLGYVFMMTFKWGAEHGKIAAPLAAWIPNIVLLACGGFLVYQKNRLPPSEGTLDPRNIPWLDQYFKKRDENLP